MSFAFLSPFFLAGVLLLGVPWLIHQIRRPERENRQFSSLMFVPRIKKEIIERRKIQHWLLLLLRMLLFLLLVLAFSRPAHRLKRLSAASPDTAEYHLLLLDTSFSMGIGNRWQEAIHIAQGVLDALPRGSVAGLLTFSDRPSVEVSLGGEEAGAGEIEQVRRVLQRVKPGNLSTEYLPALQLASQMLFTSAPSESGRPKDLNIHLISDFQRRGLPHSDSDWKLSGLIRLIAHPVTTGTPHNLGLEEVRVRPGPDNHPEVVAKIKNWTQTPLESGVRLHMVEGNTGTQEQAVRKTLRLEPFNAGTLSFSIDAGEESVAGWLELDPDEVPLDNRAYFVWRPPRKRHLYLLTGGKEEKLYSASWFIRRALVDSGPADWEVSIGGLEDWAATVRDGAASVEVVVAVDLGEMREPGLAPLTAWVERGGRLLLSLEPDPSEGLAAWLAAQGWRSLGPRFQRSQENIFDLLAHIDFGHPVFSSFQGTRFNDFSQIRFFNYATLEPSPLQGESPNSRVLAEFSSGGADRPFPAVIETHPGKGQALIWTFAPNLDTGNLAKNVKFLPMLHESLTYLLGAREEITQWRVGDRWPSALSAGPDTGPWQRMEDGSGGWKAFSGEASAQILEEPGLLRRIGGGEAMPETYAVNLDPREADPETVGITELGLRFTSARGGAPERFSALSSEKSQTFLVKEFGAGFLPWIFLLLVFEIWFAARLSKGSKRGAARNSP